MSLTNHQLRSFARHIDEGTLNENTRHATRAYLNMGLLDDEGNLTPAGLDALATVPHLIDPEPPKPVEPETRECDACEGAGARYVARVCPLTLHERTVFVQCEAPGCERGRVAERVARPVIDVDPGYQPIIDVKTTLVEPAFKLNEPVTDDRRRALLDYAVETGTTVATCTLADIPLWSVGAVHRSTSDKADAIGVRLARWGSSIDAMIMLVEPGTTPEGARAIAWDAGWCPKLGWANNAGPSIEPVKQPAKESVHSAETLALARESHRLRVCGSSRIRLQFGKYEHRRLIRVPCAYVHWLCEADFSCSACVAVFQNEQARRAAAGITVTS